MAARVTRVDSAPVYEPPLHVGVEARRLQGMEAGPTGGFWVGRSVYEPGGSAQTAPTAEETVYVVVSGELVVACDDVENVLHAGDSVHLPKGTVRSVQNRSGSASTLLVVIAVPRQDGMP